MQRLSLSASWPVHGRENIRALENRLQAHSSTPLMQMAGLATARLAVALAPHAQRIWIAAGPGNNGGDGLEAALHLHRWGKSVQVSLMGSDPKRPADAQAACLRAQQAGVAISASLPTAWLQQMGPLDLCMDALLGMGATRPLSGDMHNWVQTINQSAAPVLAVDCPTGLDPESGQALGAHSESPIFVRADHTITFIAAKPGLFMGHGRDACGHIWLEKLADLLDGDPLYGAPLTPQAWLNNVRPLPVKAHASHKGSHGDVAIVGGEPMNLNGLGMTGAAVLAATAALHAGAGRVLLSLLSGQTAEGLPPDLMQRDWQQLDLERLHVTCGCGGGLAVRAIMSEVLQRSAQLVLDADGLNAIALDENLQHMLKQRADKRPTVLTPHPLEAARLLKSSVKEVQNNRLKAAANLVNQLNCTVVLKGSGTVIAAPGETPRINISGNGLLAIGGTGDVLSGLVCARMAQGLSAFEAACSAVAQHGQMANAWPEDHALTASRLAHRLF